MMNNKGKRKLKIEEAYEKPAGIYLGHPPSYEPVSDEEQISQLSPEERAEIDRIYNNPEAGWSFDDEEMEMAEAKTMCEDCGGVGCSTCDERERMAEKITRLAINKIKENKKMRNISRPATLKELTEQIAKLVMKKLMEGDKETEAYMKMSDKDKAKSAERAKRKGEKNAEWDKRMAGKLKGITPKPKSSTKNLEEADDAKENDPNDMKLDPKTAARLRAKSEKNKEWDKRMAGKLKSITPKPRSSSKNLEESDFDEADIDVATSSSWIDKLKDLVAMGSSDEEIMNLVWTIAGEKGSDYDDQIHAALPANLSKEYTKGSSENWDIGWSNPYGSTIAERLTRRVLAKLKSKSKKRN
jgi:hypothetical protein